MDYRIRNLYIQPHLVWRCREYPILRVFSRDSSFYTDHGVRMCLSARDMEARKRERNRFAKKSWCTAMEGDASLIERPVGYKREWRKSPCRCRGQTQIATCPSSSLANYHARQWGHLLWRHLRRLFVAKSQARKDESKIKSNIKDRVRNRWIVLYYPGSRELFHPVRTGGAKGVRKERFPQHALPKRSREALQGLFRAGVAASGISGELGIFISFLYTRYLFLCGSFHVKSPLQVAN